MKQIKHNLRKQADDLDELIVSVIIKIEKISKFNVAAPSIIHKQSEFDSLSDELQHLTDRIFGSVNRLKFLNRMLDETL